MADPVGLSIGTTNLVAARVGARPVTRRCVLTYYGHRPPEVGLPSENPQLTESGLVMHGFVERVGDPVPLVAVDGSTHLADRLLVDALAAMADTVGTPSEVAIAVPAYWTPDTVRALSLALSRDRRFAPAGVAPRLVSDAVASVIALQTEPGLTSDGVIVLLDFGGSGTSITLVDAARGLQPIGDTVRHLEFSGDHIDQAVLSAVLAQVTGAADVDSAATAAVGSLARLRDQCRLAKEQLSAQTVTAINVALPGIDSEIRFTRDDLEDLIDAPLQGVIRAVEDVLQWNGRSWAEVSAVATVGGGANIPLVIQRISDQSRSRVVTTALPQLDCAIGAALVAARGPDAEAPTGIAPPVADAPTTGVGAVRDAGVVGAALAWSQDDDRAVEPVPYTEANPYAVERSGPRPSVEYVLPTGPISAPAPPARRWPQLLVGSAALIAVVAAGGVAYTLTSSSSATTSPSETTTPISTSVGPPPPPPSPETTVEPPLMSEAPPPPVTRYVPPPETVTQSITPTTTSPTTTTTTTTTTPTTPTTTTTTTTTPPTTTTTTTAPTTTATTPPTTAPTTTTTPLAPAMTTSYLTIPFLPLPIPIPVPQSP